MSVPQDLKYYKEHDWVRLDSDGVAVIGITEFAAESLGDVVFLELPEAGTEITQFQKLGEIESVKAVSDLYSPVGGTVIDRNQEAIDSPELVNESPYESGWLIRVEPADAAELDNLMTPAEYDALLAEES